MLNLWATTENLRALQPNPLLVPVVVASTVAGSVVFFGWLLRSILRNGQRVEATPFGIFEAVLAAGWLGIFLAMAVGNGSGTSSRDSHTPLTSDQILTLAAFQLVLYAIPFALLVHRRHDISVLFGLNNLSMKGALGWAVASLCAFYPIMAVIAGLTYMIYGAPPPEQDVMRMLRATTGAVETFLMICFAVVIAPTCEEFFFRGLLYGSAKKYLGFPGAALFSSLAFALVHAHLPALLPLTALGLVLVLIYERTGSLIVPMTMHALFNSVTLIASRFLPEP